MVFSRNDTDLQNKIQELVMFRKVAWKKHALKRILERNIKREEVFEALNDSQVIERHQLRRPLSSYLVLGFSKRKPIHIMLAIDIKNDMLWDYHRLCAIN